MLPIPHCQLDLGGEPEGRHGPATVLSHQYGYICFGCAGRIVGSSLLEPEQPNLADIAYVTRQGIQYLLGRSNL